MRYAYPSPTTPSSSQHLALRISRHSSCSLCHCGGLHPEPGSSVVLDNDYNDEDDDNNEGDLGHPHYIDSCACGHDIESHGADINELGLDEFNRRARVASRLDELLHNVDRLVDFGYVDEDITSLRKQMTIPGSSPSSSTASSGDPGDNPRPLKRLRMSPATSDSSSLSVGSDDDDQPLASKMGRPFRGKKPGGLKAKAATSPINLVSPTMPLNEVATRATTKPTRQKPEEKLDQTQIDRLTTGVTVDTSSTERGQKPEKIALQELRKGVIHVTAVQNDAQPRSFILLTGLKTLFQKQLPKMPREYIARLVYDTNSRALAVIKLGYKVVGGILFRPFPHRGFAEIVFFATASVDQVKGYGAMLMDHFKMHIKRTYPTMHHFLTYADNYAVGYFEKQGFSKEITLERSVWAGYIKDYEGGTIMQCTMLDKVDYLNKGIAIALQERAVMEKIRKMSKSHVVYPGLPQFQPGAPEGVTVDYREVPGLRESGWNPSMILAMPKTAARTGDYLIMEKLLNEMKDHSLAWAFLKPVDPEQVQDYYDHIKNPMDFSKMEEKLERNRYTNLDAFVTDANLVFDNCILYNPADTVYAKNAQKMKSWFKDKVARAAK